MSNKNLDEIYKKSFSEEDKYLKYIKLLPPLGIIFLIISYYNQDTLIFTYSWFILVLFWYSMYENYKWKKRWFFIWYEQGNKDKVLDNL